MNRIQQPHGEETRAPTVRSPLPPSSEMLGAPAEVRLDRHTAETQLRELVSDRMANGTAEEIAVFKHLDKARVRRGALGLAVEIYGPAERAQPALLEMMSAFGRLEEMTASANVTFSISRDTPLHEGEQEVNDKLAFAKLVNSLATL